MTVHVFGIRHHGPGSARSLAAALDELAPDVVLIEGPPEADGLVEHVATEGMEPPVAILVYQPGESRGEPARAVYYPFAIFSPEWQALLHARRRGVPARFMDLPMAHRFAMRLRRPRREIDPLGLLGDAAGYDEPELWWEHAIEERRDPCGVFEAILEAMAAVRPTGETEEEDALREAWMRRTIRAAEREGKERIAVVCGAWHAPVLAIRPPAKEDDARLRGLPKVKTTATWVPWTYGRLTLESGYGAGVRSPGWYHHLFAERERTTISWMVHVARLLRGEELDASSAGVIDAVRLADALAALRGRPGPGLGELNEATLAVLCAGSELPLRVIDRKLIVGERLGSVPESAPAVPLARDLEAQRKHLRLRFEAEEKVLDLDLRREIDRERSGLLHRLRLLGIPWGEPEDLSEMMLQGTFRERWRVAWQPEMAVAVIEAGMWGNTVGAAAAARAMDDAGKAELARLGELLDLTLLAALPDATARVMTRLDEVAALTADVLALLRTLPPLLRVLRYGDVRRTDTGTLAHVVDGLTTRASIGLPAACASLDDAAAGQMLEAVTAVHTALAAGGTPGQKTVWLDALGVLSSSEIVHGLVAGRATRILLDAGTLARQEAARRAGLALGKARAPEQAASWAEGFLRGSGLLLVHDEILWQVIDGWLGELDAASFDAVLPLLRRTFSAFEPGERRAIGERARHRGGGAATAAEAAAPFDHARGAAVLPLVARLLGVERVD